MATATTIPVTPGAGKNLDAVQVFVGGNPVDREVVVIGDPISGSHQAAVKTNNQAASVGDAALVVAISPNSSKVLINDPSGDQQAAVTGVSTAAQITDGALVVALSPNSPLPIGSNVIGTVRATGPGGGNIQVDINSSSLPSGAATNAKLPQPAAAGSPSTDVISVQSPGMNGIPLGVTPIGAGHVATGQVTIGNTATLISDVRGDPTVSSFGRRSIKITNLGAVDVFIGDASVTAVTGDLLPGARGAFVALPTTAAIFGIVASGTQAISFIEVYD